MEFGASAEDRGTDLPRPPDLLGSGARGGIGLRPRADPLITKKAGEKLLSPAMHPPQALYDVNGSLRYTRGTDADTARLLRDGPDTSVAEKCEAGLQGPDEPPTTCAAAAFFS